MEGVGARLGRSSTRYAPTTVFTGPVRKWKKNWVYVPPSNSNHHQQTVANGSNGSAHLLLYKWTPIAPDQTKDSSPNDNSGSSNGNGDSKNSNKNDDVAVEEPPKKKFKYIPIIVLEEQKNESSEQIDDEINPNELEEISKNDGYVEKPDINDVPMDESQATENNPVQRQDLNELDLSLGLNGHDGDNESEAEQIKED